MIRLLPLLGLFSGMFSIASGQHLLFTNKEGIQISAEIVTVNPDWKKMIILKDGISFEIEPSVLILDDQQIVKEWLRDRGVFSPNQSSTNQNSTPESPEPATLPSFNPSTVNLAAVIKRGKSDSNNIKLEYGYKLERRSLNFDIILTNNGRQTIPPSKMSYALVWDDLMGFDEANASIESRQDQRLAIKGEIQIPELPYNQANTFTTEKILIDTLDSNSTSSLPNDEFLGVVVNITLADGTQLKEFRSNEAISKGITFAIAEKLDSP